MGQTAQKHTLRSVVSAAWACLLALVLALGCGLGTGLVAWADGSYTITVTGASSGTYKVYQVLSGTITSGKISSANVNSDVQSYVLFALVTTSDATDDWDFTITLNDTDNDGEYDTITHAANFSGSDDAGTTTITYSALNLGTAVSDAIEAVVNAGLAQTYATNLAKAIAAATTTVEPYATGTYSDGTVTATVDETGYYLIVQTGTGDNESITSAILTTVSSSGATAYAKQSTPTVTKSVELDEETGSALTINEDGSASITYVVTGTVASNFADYDVYYYAFVDTMPSGVGTEDSTGADDVEWTITLDDDDNTILASNPATDGVTNAFTFVGETDEETGTSTATWYCQDLTGVNGVTASSTLTLTYTVTLSAVELANYVSTSSTATSGSTLTNTVHIEFSNDPNTSSNGVVDDDGDEVDDPDPTDETTDVTGNVYFYTLTITKVDASNSNTALSGAEFTLTASNGYSIKGVEVTDDDGNGTGVFIFTGLEKFVTYTLSETAPAGYKAIEDIEFTIETASSDANEGTTTYKLSVTDESGAVKSSSLDTTNYAISLTIANEEGAGLPLTGQQGIALGLIVGGLLIAVSAYSLVRRRKTQA